MKSKYKIGDKVLIVSEFHKAMDGIKGYSNMQAYCGKTMTIKSISFSTLYGEEYSMKEDGGYWSWYPCLVESFSYYYQKEILKITKLPNI